MVLRYAVAARTASSGSTPLRVGVIGIAPWPGMTIESSAASLTADGSIAGAISARGADAAGAVKAIAEGGIENSFSTQASTVSPTLFPVIFSKIESATDDANPTTPPNRASPAILGKVLIWSPVIAR